MGKAGGRKSIFITGAASGIGAETARYFVKQGWFAGLYDVNEQGLAEVADAIGGDNCTMATLDVRNRADWSAAVESFTAETDGHMNVLFNNAGIGRYGWFEEVSGDDNDQVIDVNLKGVVNGVEAALPALTDTPGARIVNTASMAGIMGAPRLAVYSATKFAVRGLSEALDVEFRDLDIRVSTLMPWFVDTAILKIGATEGANTNMSDQLAEQGMTVYPVSLAAERAWEAAHGKEVHYTVGKEADRVSFAARFMPKRLRRQLGKDLPERD